MKDTTGTPSLPREEVLNNGNTGINITTMNQDTENVI
jgi:hypothetical protein